MEIGSPFTCHGESRGRQRINNSTCTKSFCTPRYIPSFQPISLERRKIAWARINPELKSLALEEYSDRKNKLFGPGFLEKASKKMDMYKALAKVVASPPNFRKRSDPEEHGDLCHFCPKAS